MQSDTMDRDYMRNGGGNGSNTGQLLLSAAAGFVAGALLANPARKMAMQGIEAISSQDWLDALTKEHRLVQKAMRRVLETSEQDTMKRAALITKIDYALTKHSLEEEKVIYPALRRVDEQAAKALFSDHADIKTLLGELQFDIAKDDPQWIERARQLNSELEEHILEEENEVFPMFRERMTQEENATLTKHMHLQGMAVA